MRHRKRLFVDRKVQGTLMLRAVEYWFFCTATIGLSLLAWKLATGPDQPLYMFFLDAWQYFLPTAIASVLILPLLVFDILRLTNRFTGPLFRLRRELRRLAAGETVPPIRFRERDFWPDLADEFNATAQRMEMLAKLAEKGRKATDPVVRAGQETAPRGAQQGEAAQTEASTFTEVAEIERPDSLKKTLPDLPRTRW
jgi:methyl-accepting chemotaxis protein